MEMPNNQTIKADAGKPELTKIPHQILYDIANVRTYGNNKYPEGGPDNWKQVEPERYRDALFRHFLLYLRDPYGVDEESGLPHIAHMACNVAFLCELEKEKRMLSLSSTDRPTGWIPCSERLPKENEYIINVCKYYLIQDEYGDIHVAHLSSRGWETIESIKTLECDVVAWMPLPEPYREDGEA